MGRKPLISIVVPVYNVKDYLEECLKSIINQSYANLEILVVDDGSIDGSSKLCDELARLDGRIEVIHQANSGVAAARKKAILHAKGEYVGFVDGDDKISSDMIEYMVKNIGGCDVITVGCYYEEESGDWFKQEDLMEEGIYATEDELDFFHANMLSYRNRYEYGICPYLVNKMFRCILLQEIVANINFNLSYAEDAEIVFQYLLKCKAIRVSHKCLYFYRYRENSALHAIDSNYMHNLNKIYLALENIFDNHPKREILIHQLQLFTTAHIYNIAYRMGFPADAQLIRYVFPFPELEQSCRIVLYGAGNVGMDYYRLIFRRNLVHLVLWVDKGWKTYQNDYTPVHSPKEIWNYEYDYIIIAIKKEKIAKEIRQELVQMGIAEEKMLWRVPAVV